jgi:ferredoxin
MSSGPPARGFSTTTDEELKAEVVTFFFYEAYNKKKVEVKSKLRRRLLNVALDHGVDIDGVCGGELACSTCHVITEEDVFNKLPEKKEDECDMLDLATGLKPTLVPLRYQH